MDNPQTRCGYVAIVGHPNAGKSTLMNHLVGYRISAIANKPQTTRINVRGIVTEGDIQVIFTDTPGMHQRSGSLLSKSLNTEAVAALEMVDVVVMMVEAGRWTGEDDMVLERITKLDRPVFLLMNKIDRLQSPDQLLKYTQLAAEKHEFAEIFPLSATKGQNTKSFMQTLSKYLPQSDFIYPEDWITDQPTRFICSELIREQLVNYLHQEIPYTTAVEIEKFDADEKITTIHATIWVTRKGQKGIIIGKKGETLKRIGSAARRSLEDFLVSKVMLKLWVKIVEDWQNNPKHIQNFNAAKENSDLSR